MSNIKVYENNSPLITVRLKKKFPDGSTTPYLLTGRTGIEFICKNSRTDADGSARFTYTESSGRITVILDGALAGAVYSELTIQFVAADTATPGTYYQRIDVIRAAGRETVERGYLEIENV